MNRCRFVTIAALLFWTGIARASGTTTGYVAAGIIVFAIGMLPFVIFLIFWRNSIRSKFILCVAYVGSIPISFFATDMLSAAIDNYRYVLIVPMCIPLFAWIIGAILLRQPATQQGAQDRRAEDSARLS